jgi:hypothetical protein
MSRKLSAKVLRQSLMGTGLHRARAPGAGGRRTGTAYSHAKRVAGHADGRADYNLRRNKIDAARVSLSLKTRMLKEIGWKP